MHLLPWVLFFMLCTCAMAIIFLISRLANVERRLKALGNLFFEVEAVAFDTYVHGHQTTWQKYEQLRMTVKNAMIECEKIIHDDKLEV